MKVKMKIKIKSKYFMMSPELAANEEFVYKPAFSKPKLKLHLQPVLNFRQMAVQS